MDQSKKNDVHIKKVKSIQDKIEAAYGISDLKKLAEAIGLIRRDVHASFNNHEMSLVITKLQEAEHWVGEEKIKMVQTKLTEAKNWAGEYIKVLSV